MRLRTPLTELVGVEHPVVQTGMGWVAGARLVSATALADRGPQAVLRPGSTLFLALSQRV